MTTQLTQESWKDEEYFGLIGDDEIKVLSHLTEPGNNSTVVIFKFTNSEKHGDSLQALRWSVGAIMDMQTADLAQAKGGMNAMIMMEAADVD